MTRLDFIAQPWFLQMAAITLGLTIVMLLAVWVATLVAERRWPRITITVRERRRP